MTFDPRISRRKFIEATSAATAGTLLSLPIRGSVIGANDRVSIAVIGAGGQGSTLIRSLAQVPNSQITHICDIFEPNRNKGVNLAGSQPKPITDYRKLLDGKDVDGVVIATPLHMHYEIALASFEAGKHVFVEKTMMYSMKQCDLIARVVGARPSQVFQVGHQHRFDPVIRKVVDMSRDGALGKVTHIRCMWHRNGDWRRPVPKVNFDPSPWGYPDLEHLVNWRMYKRYSGGLMCELGSHMIEICNLIFGTMPSSVTGLGGIDYWKDGRETYDNVTVVYSYPEGQKASFSSTTTNAHDGEHIVIMGTEGTIEMGWDKAFYFREKESPELVKAEGATVIGSTGETMKASTQSQKEGSQVSPQDSQRRSAVYRELESYVSCIREGKKAVVDVQVGRAAAISVLSANQAMEEHRVVSIGERGRG
jgi:predicted dehydrogenase